MRLTLLTLVPWMLVAGLASAQPGGARVYEIDAANSDIHWLVYKAGAFARMGHNHVISAGELRGTVRLASDRAESRFDLEIPVSGLVVDDAASRSAAGEQFASKPSADDISGTRQNMLGKVLDADRYPVLRVGGTGPAGEDGAMLDVAVELLGRTVSFSVPVALELDGDSLEASGSFRLTHEQLGLKPFSVMMGALKVAEEIDFSYRVRAHAIAE